MSRRRPPAPPLVRDLDAAGEDQADQAPHRERQKGELIVEREDLGPVQHLAGQRHGHGRGQPQDGPAPAEQVVAQLGAGHGVHHHGKADVDGHLRQGDGGPDGQHGRHRPAGRHHKRRQPGQGVGRDHQEARLAEGRHDLALALQVTADQHAEHQAGERGHGRQQAHLGVGGPQAGEEDRQKGGGRRRQADADGIDLDVDEVAPLDGGGLGRRGEAAQTLQETVHGSAIIGACAFDYIFIDSQHEHLRRFHPWAGRPRAGSSD